MYTSKYLDYPNPSCPVASRVYQYRIFKSIEVHSRMKTGPFKTIPVDYCPEIHPFRLIPVQKYVRSGISTHQTKKP